MNKRLENSTSILKPTASSGRGGYSRLSDPKKRAHVESYLASGQTQQAYCATHKLKVSRFKNWKLRYQREKEGYFTPVTIPASIPDGSDGIRIELIKGNSKVSICEMNDISGIMAIIGALLSCN